MSNESCFYISFNSLTGNGQNINEDKSLKRPLNLKRMKGHYCEGELIVLLTHRDLRAYNYLYDHYSPALYGVLLKIVKKEEVAQDLLQDTFVKIWKSVGQYDAGKGRLFTWLINVTRNTALDYLRIQHLEILELSTASQMPSETQNIFRGFDSNDVTELINQLKTEHKTVIEMVYWQGYTHEETAERLNLPLGTVKTRIRKALNKLRFYIEKSLNQPIPVLS